MSVDTNQETNKIAVKKPMILAAAAIFALVAAGGFMFTQKGEAEQMNAKAAEVQNIEPAAGKDKATKVEEAKPAEAAAAAPAAAVGPGEIKDANANPVVAKVGAKEITRKEIFEFIATLPEQVRQMPLQQLFPLALEQVVNNNIVGTKAEQAKLDGDPDVTKLMNQAKDQIIRNVFVERELTKSISDDDLKAAYKKMVDGFQKVEEVRARHILVKDEAKAKEIIAKLDAGTPFEEMAKESTDGPTAANGGDLGYFAKGDMIPEFSDAAFSMKPGTYSKAPVKTQFGYHIIKVEDKRERAAPEFDTVKPQLEAQLRRDKLTNMLMTWQKDSAVQKFDINGDPLPEQKKE